MDNYYKFLGLKNYASLVEIKDAYRQLSKKYHPDKNDGSAYFEGMFKGLQEAYDALNTDGKKASYDKELRNYLEGYQNFHHQHQANNSSGFKEQKSQTQHQGDSSYRHTNNEEKYSDANKKPFESEPRKKSVNPAFALLLLLILGGTIFFVEKHRRDKAKTEKEIAQQALDSSRNAMNDIQNFSSHSSESNLIVDSAHSWDKTTDTIVTVKPSYEKLLIGTWISSVYVSPEDFVKTSDEKIPDGVSIEMTAEGTTTYHQGYTYNSDGYITIKITYAQNNTELLLKFYVKETGVWKIYNEETLVQTTESGVITPLDENTKSALDQNPEYAVGITPMKGQSESSRIISISEGVSEMEDLKYHIRTTSRKKY